MEHVAIDLGRPNSVLCELGSEGKKVLRRFRLDRANLTRLFSGRAACRVLIESSTESEWVARHLESLGHEVVVADPNYAAMYGERNRRVKTDGRDADALFEANRLGARALLRREGCHVPSGSAETFGDRVRDLDLPRELRELIAPLLALMDPLNEQLTKLDREMAALGKEDPRVRLLQTAPMIGVQTSTAFVALIDDVARFPKAHKVESYIGLVPSEWSSSERRIKEGITKRGDSRVRWLLVEASWSILNRPRVDTAELRNWALQIAVRRGKKIAVVALARRLGGILYAMLRDNKPYDPTRLTAAPRRSQKAVA